MKNKKNGFALIIAVIFMTVMLTLGLTMSSLGYKQELLASTAIQSQYAFYAADAALECVLYIDQKTLTSDRLKSFFVWPSSSPSVSPCGGFSISTSTPDSGQTMISTIYNISITTENDAVQRK
ncbi:MAG: pilus assembly PilX N-terminal domain-containing protein [Candidatus Kaiserbacteria bacterium]|nr:pilus assembly PilX N-terminal domain-containing protein [Candidatus Kaiserbacteria bacterium]